MGRDHMAGLFSANRSVTNIGGEGRQMQLPTTGQFPKLDQRIVRSRVGVEPVVLSGETGMLPEMASDVLGVDAGYAVENVKRDRSDVRPEAKVGLGHLVGRMLSSAQTAARL